MDLERAQALEHWTKRRNCAGKYAITNFYIMYWMRRRLPTPNMML